MRESLLVFVIGSGVLLIALGLLDAWPPAAAIWLGWCLLFCGWRLVRTR